MGAVKLGLETTEAVRTAVSEMAGLSDQFLVERMVPGFLAELIVGINRDAQFGPTLVIGAGGVLVELLRDSANLLLPVSRVEVREAILGLKMAPLLQGFRGKPRGDVEAAVDAVMAVLAYVEANAETVVELDVNPLMICAEGEGAYAADALIRIVKDEDEE